MNYNQAGVNIDAGDKFVEYIKRFTPVGDFSANMKIGRKNIVTTCDGVGTKLLVAKHFEKYDTIGIDLVASIQDTNPTNNVEDISFFSIVYPGKKWAVSFYRHSLANFEADFRIQGPFYYLSQEEPDGRISPEEGAIDLEIFNYGFSAAYDFGELSLGIGLSYYDFFMESRTDIFRVLGESDEPGARFGVPDYTSNNVAETEIERGDGSDWGFNVGFRWKILRNLSLGGVYRQGPGFDLATKAVLGPAGGLDGLFGEICGCVTERGVTEINRSTKFHVPDSYGLGIAYYPTEHVRFMFDYNIVEYSDVLDDFINPLLGLHPELIRASQDPIDSLVLDDARELHVGLEYFLLQRTVPFAFRFGAWNEPDHRIRSEGQNPASRILWRPGEDQIHYTAGFGISTRKLQVDAAFDYSKRNKTTSISMVYRF